MGQPMTECEVCHAETIPEAVHELFRRNAGPYDEIICTRCSDRLEADPKVRLNVYATAESARLVRIILNLAC